MGAWIGLLVLASGIALGADTALEPVATGADETSIQSSLIRVMGALVVVLGLFLGAAWVVRNWRRMTPRAGQVPDLRILEVKSLGPRQNLVVVGYQRQRLLIASAPSGVSLLAHLPEAGETPAAADVPRPDFSGAFREVLSRHA